MAKTAAERRAARKRREQQRARPAGPGTRSDGARSDGTQLLRRLVNDGALAVAGFGPGDPDVVADRLAALDPEVDASGVVERIGLDLVANLWGYGWQPADAVHIVRRSGSARAVRLAAALVLQEARASDAGSRAPEEWRTQLDALAEEHGGPGEQCGSLVAGWARRENADAPTAWRDVLTVVARWAHVKPLTQLCPPPSRWGRASTQQSARHADPRMLGRIRGLLAKAESTEFPEEAEALTAKAQQLMTRYAVDAAVLDAGTGRPLADEVRARRVHLVQPYADAKAQLLTVVATANGVRSVWQDDVGMATVVGLPLDLELTELLFTSLLIQATRAMTETGRAGSARTRSRSFRRSFLLAYALRIGERLEEAREAGTAEAEADTGTALVPVLAARAEAVDEALGELFPNLRTVETRISNAQGWNAGRLAADHADLRAGRTEMTG
jgi:Protein of unknown function (DUF2786)